MSWRAECRQADRSGDSAMSTSRDDSPGARMCTACSTDSADPVFAGEDGYCPSCGRRVVADRDHMEEDLGQVARVSDRGLRHSRNEDAMHFAVADTDEGPVAVAIVCDGVSSAVGQGQVTVCWLGDSRAYWLAANAPAPAGPNDTIDITGGSRRVTRDDSLAEEIVAAGLASMDDAMGSPQAHVITRGLGAA